MKKKVINIKIDPRKIKELKDLFKEAGIPTDKETLNHALAIAKRKMGIDGAPKKKDMH